MNLINEVNEARLQIHTDSYPMSIGELVSLYDEKELNINPKFQRVYRWNTTQKSRLIESIFLGIPLPSIFVSQRSDGVWDVVDGLQRLSTILSFMGKLKDENYPENNFLATEKTKYLPSLANKKWDELAPELKRIFKREKIDIKIIKRESDENAKLELFQRLNTGGSELTAQEIRNCLLIMINYNAFEYVKNLSSNSDFLETMPISEKKSEEASYEEYVIRYFIQQFYDKNLRNKHTNIGPYFDEATITLFHSNSKFEYEKEQKIFEKTFSTINKALGEDAFKKFNNDEKKYKGPVLNSIFEILTLIIANKIKEEKILTQDYIQNISRKASEKIQCIPPNSRPIDKMDLTYKIAQELLDNEKN